MKKSISLALVFVMSLSLYSCATYLTRTNEMRDKLATIRIGMSTLQVIEIAGQPHSKETLLWEDGELIQFYKYITEYTLDGPVLNSDLTPVCLKQDKVIGIGHKFYKERKKTAKKILYP
ncbi:MAG: DUF3192 domain-containing protein [Candidatus Omnitrophota bacterium]|nr:MAG: DUF3192 domain-containing protein [Candidatus Omnitrophota bacterium]